MNKRIKKLWIKALRSGEYQQGQSSLREQSEEPADNCFCCLGVLCDIYRRCEGKGSWLGAAFFVSGSSSMAQLPDPVRQWAGLEQRDPHLGDDTAISLNDRGYTFSQIADRIEKYL